MSEQGLEVLDATYQKTQEWIGSLAETSHLEKGEAYKALRAVLMTLRDRLPMLEAVHFGAQLHCFCAVFITMVGSRRKRRLKCRAKNS